MALATADDDSGGGVMLQHLAKRRDVETRSISPENFDGAKGGGGRATTGTGAECARDLGVGWKVSPSVEIAGGATFTLAEIAGPAVITHIWLTTHRDNWRRLVLRAYWDGATEPAIEVPWATSSAGWVSCAALVAADRRQPERRVQLVLGDAVPLRRA